MLMAIPPIEQKLKREKEFKRKKKRTVKFWKVFESSKYYIIIYLYTSMVREEKSWLVSLGVFILHHHSVIHSSLDKRCFLKGFVIL